jgi:alkylhydroperoxidase family enzyme
MNGAADGAGTSNAGKWAVLAFAHRGRALPTRWIHRMNRGINTARPALIALCPCGNMQACSRNMLNERYRFARSRRGRGTGKETKSMSKPWISYVHPATVKDQAMLAEFDRCAREGTPRPESQAIRAHVPAVFWSFANSWRDVFKNGVADHAIKELCRIYVSRSVLCEFCGNQRSIKAAKQGIVEDDYRDLINFESSTRYDERQKAALAYAEAITWDLPVDEKFWARLHKHFSEPELVEIGYFVALTMGQQRWLRTLNIEHHQILAGTDASMAPGFESEDALTRSKQAADYWAKTKAKTQTQAAE